MIASPGITDIGVASTYMTIIPFPKNRRASVLIEESALKTSTSHDDEALDALRAIRDEFDQLKGEIGKVRAEQNAIFHRWADQEVEGSLGVKEKAAMEGQLAALADRLSALISPWLSAQGKLESWRERTAATNGTADREQIEPD